jgi:hypothetical protein
LQNAISTISEATVDDISLIHFSLRSSVCTAKQPTDSGHSAFINAVTYNRT